MGGKSGGNAAPAPSYPAGFNPEAPRMGEAAVGTPGDYGGFDQFRDALWGWRYQDWMAEQNGAMEMPDFGHMFESINSQNDTYAAQLEAQRAAAERAAGENDRDSLYSDYLSAAEASTDYINNMLGEQQANARLMGTKFEITDEQKQTMINDYFASVWGAGDQQRLEGLFKQWGNPSGFEGFTIMRGDGSKFGGEGGEGEGGPESVARSTGKKGTLATAKQDDETLGKGASLLGGAAA